MDQKTPAGVLTLMLTLVDMNEGVVRHTLLLTAEQLELAEDVQVPLTALVDERGQMTFEFDDPPELRRVRTFTMESTVRVSAERHVEVHPATAPPKQPDSMTAKERWAHLLRLLRSA